MSTSVQLGNRPISTLAINLAAIEVAWLDLVRMAFCFDLVLMMESPALG
jgi:hypothetical protein